MIPLDPGSALDAAGRAELLRLLVPVADELGVATARPPAVADDAWVGPAARACAALELELRGRLVTALVDVERALAAVRSAR